MLATDTLLAHVGLDVGAAPGTGAARSGVFLTNAALCLKRGGAQALVSPLWFEHCGARFLRPQIELVCPRVVVALGERAYIAIMTSFAKPPQRFRFAVDSPNPVELTPTTLLVPVYHCGSRILNTHRKLPQQFTDWIRVRAALARNDSL
jgi:hypothetical protein